MKKRDDLDIRSVKKDMSGRMLFQDAMKEYHLKHFDRALKLLNSAQKEAVKKESHKLELDILIQGAHVHLFQGDFVKAILSIELAESYANLIVTSHKIKLHGYLGISEFNILAMRNEEAEEMLNVVLKSLQGKSDFDIEARALGLIAEIYKHRANYNFSIYYFKRQLALYVKLKNNRQACKSMINISKIFFLMGDFDRSIVFLDKAESKARRNNYLDLKGEGLVLRAEIHSLFGDLASAELCIKEINKLANDQNIKLRGVEHRIWICKVALAYRMYDMALERALALYQEFGQFKSPRNIFELELLLIMAQAYLGLDKYQLAMKWLWKCIYYALPHFIYFRHILMRAIESMALADIGLTQNQTGYKLIELIDRMKSSENSAVYRRHYAGKYDELQNWQIVELLSKCKDGKITIFRKGIIRVDLQSGWVYKGNVEAKSRLSKQQLKVFKLLAEKIGKIVSTKDILKAVGYYSDRTDKEYTDGLARYYISQVRKKIEFGDDKSILTKNGGYMIPKDS